MPIKRVATLSIVLFLLASPTQASAPLNEPVVWPETYEERAAATRVLVEKYAEQYEVSAEQMYRTIGCESSYDAKAHGDGHLGGSHGLVQIHAPSHPTISREQAENPEFAVSWMAYQFSKGNQSWWTCFRNIYGD